MFELGLILLVLAALISLWMGVGRLRPGEDVMEQDWLAPDDPRLLRNQMQGGQDDEE